MTCEWERWGTWELTMENNVEGKMDNIGRLVGEYVPSFHC